MELRRWELSTEELGRVLYRRRRLYESMAWHTAPLEFLVTSHIIFTSPIDRIPPFAFRARSPGSPSPLSLHIHACA